MSNGSSNDSHSVNATPLKSHHATGGFLNGNGLLDTPLSLFLVQVRMNKVCYCEVNK